MKLKGQRVNMFNSELREDSAIDAWLSNSVKPNTAEVYIRNFGGWYEWLKENGASELRNLSPRELVDRQRELSRAYYLGKIMKPERKQILYEVIRYTEEKGSEWTTSYKQHIYAAVRSFLIYYLEDEEVPKLNNGEKGRLKGRRGIKKELNIEILRDIIFDSNPMYKAAFSCMLCSGMGIGELIKWSNSGIDELREALNNPIRFERMEIIELYLGARKIHLDEDFYVYIGGSALEFLKAWMKHREEREREFHSAEVHERRRRYYESAGKEIPPLPDEFPKAIFINNTYKPLNRGAAQFYYTSKIYRLKKKQKVENGTRATRYHLNMHQTRSVFRTRWQKSKADGVVGEYFMGHIKDKLGYLRIHEDREYRISEYFKALPWLDIKKIEIEKARARTRLQSIVDRARLDGWLEDDIKKLEDILQSKETFEEGVFEFQNLEMEIKLEQERSEKWDFKIVDEREEMIFNARDGWEVFKALNDGRYLLRRHL